MTRLFEFYEKKVKSSSQEGFYVDCIPFLHLLLISVEFNNFCMTVSFVALRRIFIDDDCKEHIVPRGGRSMVNGNIELRIPLLKKVGAVLFQDLGALSGTMFC